MPEVVRVIPTNGHAEPLLEVAQQVQNLRLNGHVQRGGGFVGHQELGLAGQGHGDHHALLHAAGHFKGIIFDARFRRGNADELEQAQNLQRRYAAFSGRCSLSRFLDLGADAEDGVQRRARFLKNVADHAAADATQFGGRHFQGVAAVQQDFPADVMRRRHGHEPRDGLGGDAFAAATAFADDRQTVSPTPMASDTPSIARAAAAPAPKSIWRFLISSRFTRVQRNPDQ